MTGKLSSFRQPVGRNRPELSCPCPPHTRATLAGGVPHVRGSSLKNLLRIVFCTRVTEATRKCQGTAAKLSPSSHE